MAAARVGEEVLAEFYGYDEPAGGNPGPPAQAGIDSLELIAKEEGFASYEKLMEFENFVNQIEWQEHIEYIESEEYKEKEKLERERELHEASEELEYMNSLCECCFIPKEFRSSADDFILPLEITSNPLLCEPILKHVIKKIEERGEMGWDEVNEVIREAPVWGTRIVFLKYRPCPYNGLCDLCPKQGDKKHYIEPPWFCPEDYEEEFLKYW